MPRMRTIDATYKYVIEQDTESSITQHALRMLVKSGKVPSVRIGSKYLIDIDTLFNYLGLKNVG